MTASHLKNRYRVLQLLGSGGFGETFLAEDVDVGRHCVVKRLMPLMNNPQTWTIVLEKFRQEAKVLVELGEACDQIPHLYDYFEEAGQFYLVQQWIEGQTLSQLVATSGPVAEQRVKEILIQILEVLQLHIHARKKIHRDLKPDNIILRRRDGKPVLIDFGAVKEVVTSLQSRSVAIGTPGFMAPEQAAGHPVYASDLYSLGLTGIYLLTGKHPGELCDPMTGEFHWQRDVPSISLEFAAVLERSIQPQAHQRYALAQDMLDALQTPSSSLAPTQPPAAPTQPPTGFYLPISANFPASTVPPDPVSPPPAIEPHAPLLPASSALSVPLATQAIQSTPTPEPGLSRKPLWLSIGIGLSLGVVAGGLAWFVSSNRPSNQSITPSPTPSPTETPSVSFTDRTRAQELTAQGLDRLSVDDFSEAIDWFDQAIDRDATYGDAYANRGLAYAYLSIASKADGNLQQATLYSQRAIEDAGTALQRRTSYEPLTYFTYGLAYDVQDQDDQAIEYYQRAVATETGKWGVRNPAYAYNNLGVIDQSRGNLQQAIDHYTAATAADDAFALAYHNRGTAKYQLEDFAGAIADLSLALEREDGYWGNSSPADAYYLRGALYAKQSDQFATAIADYDQTYGLNPDFQPALDVQADYATAFLSRADSQLITGLEQIQTANGDASQIESAKGQLNQAIQDYTQAIALNSDLAIAYYHRGAAYAETGNAAQAIADHQQALERNVTDNTYNANYATAYFNSGFTHLEQGNVQAAIDDYSKAIELNDELAAAYFNRGLAYQQQGDRDRARDDFRKAERLYRQQDNDEEAERAEENYEALDD